MLLIKPLLLTLIAFGAISVLEGVRDVSQRRRDTRSDVKPSTPSASSPGDAEILRYIQELTKKESE